MKVIQQLLSRKICFWILPLMCLFPGQSCVTIKNIWEDINELPQRIHNDQEQYVGYPGVNVFEEEVPEDDSKSITGFFGIVRSNIYGSDKWEDPSGMQAGIIYPFYSINNFFDLRAEANFSMQGAKWEEADIKGRTNLVYFNVPLVVRYKTNFGLFADAGIQPGFLISARKYEGTVDNYMVNMRKFDFAFPVGIGYEFKSNFGIGLRVIPGITDITRYAVNKDRNFVIALRGTYTFKLE